MGTQRRKDFNKFSLRLRAFAALRFLYSFGVTKRLGWTRAFNIF
jgi:hypothetical protein